MEGGLVNDDLEAETHSEELLHSRKLDMQIVKVDAGSAFNHSSMVTNMRYEALQPVTLSSSTVTTPVSMVNFSR